MESQISLLHGVHAALPTPWDERGRPASAVVHENVARLVDAGVHGVYTTGTDGEWYALEYDNFRRLIEAFAAAVQGQPIASQVGVTWLNTEGMLQRARFGVDCGIPLVQVAFPPWLALSRADQLDFFQSLAQAVPEAGIIHYNTRKTKNFLAGEDYVALRDAAPNLIGTKFMGTLDELLDVVRDAPHLRHFTHDEAHAPGRLFGAAGVYSWLVNVNPRKALEIHAACERGDWPRAIHLQQRVRELAKVLAGLQAQGYTPAATGSAVTALAGFLEEDFAVRAPHRAVSAAEAAALGGRLQAEFSEFLRDS